MWEGGWTEEEIYSTCRRPSVASCLPLLQFCMNIPHWLFQPALTSPHFRNHIQEWLGKEGKATLELRPFIRDLNAYTSQDVFAGVGGGGHGMQQPLWRPPGWS